MKTIDWRKLYAEKWGNEVVPDATSHPAKYNRGLIRKIYQFLLQEGLVKSGETVLDCFGGVSLGARDALGFGLNWIGVELEEKFWQIGGEGWICPGNSRLPAYEKGKVIAEAAFPICAGCIGRWRKGQTTHQHHAEGNLEYWRRKYGHTFTTSARLLHGDSRELIAVLERNEIEICVSSPPFVGITPHSGGDAGFIDDKRLFGDYGSTPGNIANMKEGDPAAVVASPPYEGARIGSESGQSQVGHGKNYGEDPAQLANLKAGDIDTVIVSPPYANTGAANQGTSQRQASNPDFKFSEQKGDDYNRDNPSNLANLKAGNVDSAIASPPYSDISAGAGGLNTKPGKDGQQSGRNADSPSQSADQRYGDSVGQLSKMKSGESDAIISSSPYESTISSQKSGIDWSKTHRANGAIRDETKEAGFALRPGAGNEFRYSASENNLGNARGETFWGASKQIVSQVYAVLKPGGVAAWIVKSFVREKTLVDFPDQWKRLCESVGFETTHYIRAWQVEDDGTQAKLEGGIKHKTKSRKGFFRRLGEAKGAPPIDYEVVLVMKKAGDIQPQDSRVNEQ